ncbi:MAG: hypothetical protein AABY91_09990 [Gemmatimonadota bacterium]
MILTIRVDELLQLTLSRPSRDLVTRPTGAAIRGSIERAIAATTCPTTLLDFEWVGLIDFSCADEVVAKLLRVVDAGVYIVLRGVDETQAEAIDDVLARQGLAVTALPRAGGLQMLGYTTPDLSLAFQMVHAPGSGDATRQAGRLGWSLERAADALQTLAMRRLILAAGGTFAPLPLQ